MTTNIQTRVSGVWRQAGAIYVNIGGTWKEVAVAYTKIAGVWKESFKTLEASDDGPATGAIDGLRAPETGVITVTADGGSGGYTILWEYVSGDTDVACDDTVSFTTFWTVPSNPTGKFATWKYTVTDSFGDTVEGTVGISFPSSA